MLYCNGVGSQTEIVFDGGSLVFDKNANLIKQLPLFEEAFDIFELKDDGTFTEPVKIKAENLPDAEYDPAELDYNLCTAEIYAAIVTGIKDYFSKMGFTKEILGSS
jgi:NAD+ synthase (glutamine-hydrolysing)